MNNASIGTNYVILTKRVKVQQEKKPASNSKCMQSVVFEQTFTKQFLKRRKNVAETISVTINDSSDLLCFELYLINIFVKSAKGRELRRCYLQSDTYYLSLIVEDLNLQQRYRHEDKNISGTCYFITLNSNLGVWQAHDTNMHLIFPALNSKCNRIS